MKNLKTIRILSVIVLILCAFKLGEVTGESNYLKRVAACVKLPDVPDIQTFYGHNFKDNGLEHTLWNHAIAHNANIYINCIFKDLHRNE